MGDVNVGKTSLILRYTDNTFAPAATITDFVRRLSSFND